MLIDSFSGDMNHNGLCRSFPNVIQRADLISDNCHSSSVIDFQPAVDEDRQLVEQLSAKLSKNIGPGHYLDRAVLVLQLKQSEPIALLGRPDAQLSDNAPERHLVAMTA